MRLDRQQLELLAKYFADVLKVLIASLVIGYFIPNESGSIPLHIVWMGAAVALASLAASIVFIRE